MGRKINPVDFQRLRTGDNLALTETTFNSMVEVAEAWRRGGMGKLESPPLEYPFEANVVMVQNTSGGTLNAFSVVGIDAPIFTDSQDLDEFRFYPRFKVVSPLTATESERGHRGRFCVTIDPMADNACGRAVVSGVVAVKLKVTEEETAVERAGIEDGQTGYLVPAPGGPAEVLWQAEGYGEVWSIIRLSAGQAVALRPFELTENLVPGITSPVNNVDAVFLDDPDEQTQTLYWMGTADDDTPEFTLGIGRGRDDNYGVDGTRGWAKWNPEGYVDGDTPPGRWEIVWGDFTLRAQAVVGSSIIARGATGTVRLWWWSAPAAMMVDTGIDITVRNIGPRPLAPAEIIAIYYGRTEDQWFYDTVSEQVFYGLAQSDWQEGGTRPADPFVTVKFTDRAGSDVVGSEFPVYLPRVGDQDPQVYAAAADQYPGDVVQFRFDSAGEAVACGSYLGPRLGTITAWAGTEDDIPYGWCLADGSHGSPNLAGRFLMCADTSEGAASDEGIGDTGGYSKHGKTENGHPAHGNHRHDLSGTFASVQVDPAAGGAPLNVLQAPAGPAWSAGADILAGGPPLSWEHTGPADDDTDNRPRYYALAFIYRWK